MKPEICEGNIVFSKKGRDKGHLFVVLLCVDADFVLVCDGERRKLDHLKRKRRKHLQAMPYNMPELIALYRQNALKDSDVRKAILHVNAAPDAPRGTEKKEDASIVQD